MFTDIVLHLDETNAPVPQEFPHEDEAREMFAFYRKFVVNCYESDFHLSLLSGFLNKKAATM